MFANAIKTVSTLILSLLCLENAICNVDSPENKPIMCLVTLLIDISFYILTDPPV